MYCVRKITDDLTWVGANDRRLHMFEGVYYVPAGVSYNSYLLCDEKTVLFDTVDTAVQERFLENVSHALSGRPLDYLVVQHMEPDHSASILEMIARYPNVRIVCNKKTLQLIRQFYDLDSEERVMLVAEGDVLSTGRHALNFIMAPMVHWPEVMVTYDVADKILFSADAFGCFGALNGALFADEVNFAVDYMDEARRYYANIVGKYGPQVDALLGKASALSIEMICPLHGFVWRRDIPEIATKYALWSRYEPEERGVMIAYASVYGHTENVAEMLACRLRDRGIKTAMYDVSITPAPVIVSAAFRWSHLVFASTTYNMGIFVAMESLIYDLVAHNIQNRTVAIIENGSWAATSGKLIRAQLEKCKNMTFTDGVISIKSGIRPAQLPEIDAMADALASFLPASPEAAPDRGERIAAANPVDRNVLRKVSYGLFVLTVRDGEKDNGCIINTVTQITDSPLRISIAVNRANHTRDMIAETGEFNVSILSERARFGTFECFGFRSGRDSDKFAGCGYDARAANGVRYVPECTNGVISARVTQTLDFETHTLFIAEVTEAFALSDEPSATYQYYHEHIKPKPQIPKEKKKGFICKICGYVYEGDVLPDDFICPLCKHGAEDFEPLG